MDRPSPWQRRGESRRARSADRRAAARDHLSAIPRRHRADRAALSRRRRPAAATRGGCDASGGERPWRTAMKWITREHPRVDRVACPWLIEKFVDKQAEFIYVPADQVMAEAQKRGATRTVLDALYAYCRKKVEAKPA